MNSAQHKRDHAHIQSPLSYAKVSRQPNRVGAGGGRTLFKIPVPGILTGSSPFQSLPVWRPLLGHSLACAAPLLRLLLIDLRLQARHLLGCLVPSDRRRVQLGVQPLRVRSRFEWGFSSRERPWLGFSRAARLGAMHARGHMPKPEGKRPRGRGARAAAGSTFKSLQRAPVPQRDAG